MTTPKTVKTNLILSVLLAVLGWTFFAVFTLTKPDSALLPGIQQAATVYTVVAPVIVLGVLKKNLWAVRIGWTLNLLISVPVGAAIGIAFALISVGLTFKASARQYFATA